MKIYASSTCKACGKTGGTAANLPVSIKTARSQQVCVISNLATKSKITLIIDTSFLNDQAQVIHNPLITDIRLEKIFLFFILQFFASYTCLADPIVLH